LWSNYGAYPSAKKGILQFGGNGEGGIRGVEEMCKDVLTAMNE